jgi:hypothetical protein
MKRWSALLCALVLLACESSGEVEQRLLDARCTKTEWRRLAGYKRNWIQAKWVCPDGSVEWVSGDNAWKAAP